LFILLGLVLNEWLLTFLFSNDGIIESRDRTLIWSLEIVLIGLGLGFIGFKDLIARSYKTIVTIFVAYFIFPSVLFIFADIYIGYRDLVQLHQNIHIKDGFTPKGVTGGVVRCRSSFRLALMGCTFLPIPL